MSYKIKLTASAVAAANHCLGQVEPKGRSEIRNHSRCARAIRDACFKEEEITENIENKIGNGLIEELVIQAAEELNLSHELSALKCWEELEEKPLDDQWVYFGKKI